MVLHERQAALEEQAIVLLQTYLQFWPGEVDLSWLPVPDIASSRDRGTLRFALGPGQANDSANKAIEVALRSLEKWSDGQDEFQSALEEAIATGGLVLQTNSRRVYWEGKLVEVDWMKNARQWEFLDALAQTRGRSPVYPAAVYGNVDGTKGFDALKVIKCKLVSKLPVSLASKIKAIPRENCYRLDLTSDRVFLLAE
jgi:hypothetical protein